MSSVQRSRPKRLLVILGASLGACLILFGPGIMLPRFLYPVSRSTDCGWVARAFADTLMTGDASLARLLTVSDAGIDEWMSARRGVSCPFSWDDETSTGLVCGPEGTEGSEQWNCGFSYACIRRDYYFTLESLKLEQMPDGCRVIYWSPPCEAFGDEVGKTCR